jgi:nucleoside 2-deoxyribosyltransferase
MPKAYVASPLGFSELGRSAYYAELIPLIQSAGYEVLDPWRLTGPSVVEKALKAPEGSMRRRRWNEVNAIIGRNNCRAIERCDLLVAILDGVDVDSGTAAEIGYAAGIGKPIIGYRSDFRLSADNEGAVVNLQVEYFVRMRGGSIVSDLASLKRMLQARSRKLLPKQAQGRK